MDGSQYKSAELFGLVLAGGNSSRMGFDKSQLIYKDNCHDIYTAELISEFCTKTYISKSDHPDKMIGRFEVMNDIYKNKGPMAALYTAIGQHPDKALLVMPCDLPNIDRKTISTLTDRSKHADIRCLKSPNREHPESLVAVYEPSSFNTLKAHFERDQLSLWKLINELDAQIIELDSDQVLFNANKPDDLRELRKKQ